MALAAEVAREETDQLGDEERVVEERWMIDRGGVNDRVAGHAGDERGERGVGDLDVRREVLGPPCFDLGRGGAASQGTR